MEIAINAPFKPQRSSGRPLVSCIASLIMSFACTGPEKATKKLAKWIAILSSY
jgi:hypothetical protein